MSLWIAYRGHPKNNERDLHRDSHTNMQECQEHDPGIVGFFTICEVICFKLSIQVWIIGNLYQPLTLLSNFPCLSAWGGCTTICYRLHIYPAKAGVAFLYHYAVLWFAQIIEYIMARRSYSLVCTLHYLIIIIMHIYIYNYKKLVQKTCIPKVGMAMLMCWMIWYFYCFLFGFKCTFQL